MKKYFILTILLSITYSCKTVTTKTSDTSNTNNKEEDVTLYFKAGGNEPFWGITIGKEKTVFTSLIEGKEKIS